MSKLKGKVRHYDAEFKDRATQLYHSSKKSYAELSETLGIPTATLGMWVHNAKKDKSQQSDRQAIES